MWVIGEAEQRRARPQPPCALRVPAARRRSERDPSYDSDRLLAGFLMATAPTNSAANAETTALA